MKKLFILSLLFLTLSAKMAFAENCHISAQQNVVFVSEDSSTLCVVVTSSSKSLQLAVDKAEMKAKVSFANHLKQETLRAVRLERELKVSRKGKTYIVLALVRMPKN